jgi:hypothetical protein
MLYFAIILVNLMCINTLPVSGLASLGRLFSKIPFKSLKLKSNPFKKVRNPFKKDTLKKMGNPFTKAKSKFSRKGTKVNTPTTPRPPAPQSATAGAPNLSPKDKKALDAFNNAPAPAKPARSFLNGPDSPDNPFI